MHLTSLKGREEMGTQAQVNADPTVSTQAKCAGTVGCWPSFHSFSALGSPVGTALVCAGMFKLPWGSSI